MSFQKQRLVGLATLGFVLMLATGCGDDSKPKSSPESSSTSMKPGAIPQVSFTIAQANLGTSAGALPLGNDVVAAAMKPVEAWAQSSVVDAFVRGSASSTGGIFDEAVLAEAAKDSGVLTDAGLPKLTGPATITLQSANLTALGNPTQPSVIGVQIAFTIKANVKGGTMESTRIGEFSLKDNGGWKIVAYDVGVDRTGPGVPASLDVSTASSASSTDSEVSK